jgi:hypothetical protein
MTVIPDRIFITHITPAYRTTVKKELKRIKGVNIEVINDKTVISL